MVHVYNSTCLRMFPVVVLLVVSVAKPAHDDICNVQGVEVEVAMTMIEAVVWCDQHLFL